MGLFTSVRNHTNSDDSFRRTYGDKFFLRVYFYRKIYLFEGKFGHFFKCFKLYNSQENVNLKFNAVLQRVVLYILSIEKSNGGRGT